MKTLALVLVGALSLALDLASARALQALGVPDGPSRLFVLPLFVSLVLYLSTGPGQSFRLPTRTPDDELVPRAHHLWMLGIWAGIVLVGGAAMLAMRGRTVLLDAVGFLVTHPLSQALLFQGAIFQLANARPRGDARMKRDDMPLRTLVIVGALQGLSQLQYLGPITWSATGQVLRVTFLSGLLLTGARAYWGSLWPVLAAYAINNAIFLYGGRPLGFHF